MQSAKCHSVFSLWNIKAQTKAQNNIVFKYIIVSGSPSYWYFLCNSNQYIDMADKRKNKRSVFEFTFYSYAQYFALLFVILTIFLYDTLLNRKRRSPGSLICRKEKAKLPPLWNMTERRIASVGHRIAHDLWCKITHRTFIESYRQQI